MYAQKTVIGFELSWKYSVCILNVLFSMIQKHQFFNKEIYLEET